jgi:ribosomal protein S8E
MSTHSSLATKKTYGGKNELTSKKKYEAGGFPAETVLGEPKRKTTRGMGGNGKIKP